MGCNCCGCVSLWAPFIWLHIYVMCSREELGCVRFLLENKWGTSPSLPYFSYLPHMCTWFKGTMVASILNSLCLRQCWRSRDLGSICPHPNTSCALSRQNAACLSIVPVHLKLKATSSISQMWLFQSSPDLGEILVMLHYIINFVLDVSPQIWVVKINTNETIVDTKS